MNRDLKILVDYRLQQARDALSAAETLLKSELWRDAINRAYYAEFYAVMALLAERGLGTSKHAGVISLFDRVFVKSGEFPKGFSKMLHRAFDMRQEADYEELASLGKEEAEEAVKEASTFLDGVLKKRRTDND